MATGLETKAMNHWQIHRPKMYQTLKKEKTLQKAAEWASESACQLGGSLVHQGMDWDAARELALQMFVLLPSEEEEEVLSPERTPFV